MLVKPEERQPLAELLYFLELGEQLAHEVAATQATIAPTTKMHRFLEGQARQEAFHATVFRTSRMWIAPPAWPIPRNLMNRLKSLGH